MKIGDRVTNISQDATMLNLIPGFHRKTLDVNRPMVSVVVEGDCHLGIASKVRDVRY
jgi:hypothetical protein